jgi:hypothetical protein
MRNSWRMGLVLGLAVLGGGTTATAQADGDRDDRTPAQARRSRSNSPNGRTFAPPQQGVSYNRLTTARPAVVASSQAAWVAPYSSQAVQAQPRAARSSWQQGPQRAASPPPGMVRSTPYTYYPGMRPEQHPNANTAQITRGGHICIPSRGQFFGGPSRVHR